MKDPTSKTFLILIYSYLRWWITRSPDTRMSMIPWFFSFVAGTSMYNFAVYLEEREVYKEEKAKIPEDFTEEGLNKFREYK